MFFNKPLLDGLFEDVALTNSQWKRSLILSSVYTMLSNDDPYVDLLDTFLTYKERLHCSESLLLTKFALSTKFHFSESILLLFVKSDDFLKWN